MKVKLVLIVTFLLASITGCATSNMSLSDIVTKLGTDGQKLIDLAWTNKDCLAGFANSQMLVRNVSTDTKVSVGLLVAAADQSTEQYKKCFYTGNLINAGGFAAKDAIADNAQLLNLLESLTGIKIP